MVARLEYGPQSPNPRFVISSRYDDGFKLYYKQYCARGDMENRIKDQQLGLFADRTSSTQLDDRAPPARHQWEKGGIVAGCPESSNF